jgi:hypothetical protein
MLKKQKKREENIRKKCSYFQVFLVFFIFITNFFFSKAKTTS